MQNKKNHVMYYPLHHFIYLPVTLFFGIFSVYKYSTEEGNTSLIWGLSAFFSFMLLFLSIMLRQHYALKLQDRIILNEFKFRFYRMSGKDLDQEFPALNKSQIFALRFAGDQELLNLISNTNQKKLSPKEIKDLITQWVPDNQRV